MAGVLLFDVGNTHTTVALTSDGKEFKKFRISTQRYETEDELYVFLRTLFGEMVNAKPIVVSSVVPSVNIIFEYFASKYGSGEVYFVKAEDYDGIVWAVNYPKEIGADRVCDVIAAFKEYGPNCIVVDYGTAITIEVLKEGRYEGGAILPGFKMMVHALFRGTAKLPQVELKPYDGFVGKDTDSNIRIGTINATVGAVKYLVENISREYRENPVIVHTGGQASLVAGWLDGIVDPDLTLRGMYYFYEAKKNLTR
ncbi:type III pantothenate kinase [Fervidobacterium thailandense]|uniref:Type III pantothenate kinase n=1 Tax=Fervidobacterium thailandense TaxID=1008305 RepID=A0A1E3G3L5_9BACT|nr:type III pantothenate kinase [Fervidobacterium thailandense]ODN30844.1 pantothenate kinase [Fervidobacterium thailandense]